MTNHAVGLRSVLLLTASLLAPRLPAQTSADQPDRLPVETRTLADVVATVSGSVVFVSTEVGSGSGFYVNPTGWVITARHVVILPSGKVASKISVHRFIPAYKGNGVQLAQADIHVPATLVEEDEDHDLALLSTNTYLYGPPVMTFNGNSPIEGNHPATLCTRTVKLRSGDHVFTVGHPLGDEREITTQGIVASSQPDEFDKSGNPRGTYFVDMLINHGNSGGPVFAETGCVIGVADAIKLAAVEAVGPDNKALPQAPGIPVITPDGKPILDKDGKPEVISLEYSSGLGLVIPQQYIVELLDKAGGRRIKGSSLMPPSAIPPPSSDW